MVEVCIELSVFRRACREKQLGLAQRTIKSTAFDFDTIPIGIGLRLWEEAAGSLPVDIRKVRATGELAFRCGRFLGDVRAVSTIAIRANSKNGWAQRVSFVYHLRECPHLLKD